MTPIQWEELSEIVIAGIDGRDYPDFVDAYIESAIVRGKRYMTEEEHYYVNEVFSDVIQEMALEEYLEG